MQDFKSFAEKEFEKLPPMQTEWNIIHARCMIYALHDLGNKNKRLEELAYVHDIGKAQSEKDHAQISVQILEKSFKLSDMDKDCILNHGSGAQPKTKEGKVFRFADGLSIFYPECVRFQLFIGAKEGLSVGQVQDKLAKCYSKYLEAYKDDKLVLDLIVRLYSDALKMFSKG